MVSEFSDIVLQASKVVAQKYGSQYKVRATYRFSELRDLSKLPLKVFVSVNVYDENCTVIKDRADDSLLISADLWDYSDAYCMVVVELTKLAHFSRKETRLLCDEISACCQAYLRV